MTHLAAMNQISLKIAEIVEHAASGDVCTLAVTLRDSRGALARVAAVLSSMPVLALSYEVEGYVAGDGAAGDGALATAQIRVPGPDGARARAKLNRMVDVLAVTELPAGLR